jgi:hypothetical protein
MTNQAEMTNATAEPRELRPLLTAPQAAEHLGVTPDLLERWRGAGTGPAFVRLSPKHIRYKEADLDEFVAARRRQSTAG